MANKYIILVILFFSWSFLYCQGSVTLETFGTASDAPIQSLGTIPSGVSLFNFGYALVSAPNQCGIVRRNGEWDMSAGFKGTLWMNFGNIDGVGEGPVFLITEYDVGNIDIQDPNCINAYLDTAQTYFAVKFNTVDDHRDLQRFDEMELIKSKNGIRETESRRILPIDDRNGLNAQNATNIEDGRLHSVGLTYNAKSNELVLTFDGTVLFFQCINMLDALNLVDSTTYIQMAACSGPQGDFISFGLSDQDFFTNCCPENQSGCLNNADLRSWYPIGNPEDNQWEFLGDTKVRSKNNSAGVSLFTLPIDLINIEGVFDMVVPNSSNDEDCIGFVLGMKKPNCNSVDSIRGLFFNWVGKHPTADTLWKYAGWNFVSVDGHFPVVDPSVVFPYFYQQNIGNGYNRIYFGDKYWEYNTTYKVRFRYTSENVSIWINDSLYVSHDGCFGAGRFAFFSHSQRFATFSNFSYRSLIKLNHDTHICVGQEANLNIINGCNGQSVSTAFSAVKWDFGDGKLLDSNLVQVNHRFAYPGTFKVEVAALDNNKCLAFENTFVEVRPPPNPPDYSIQKPNCDGGQNGRVILHPYDSLHLYAFDGAAYSSELYYDNLTAGLYTLLTKDGFGCESHDSIEVNDPSPLSAFIVSGSSLHATDTIHLRARTIPGGAAIKEYHWTSSIWDTTCLCPLIAVSPVYGSEFTVQLVDTLGCEAEASVSFSVDEAVRLFIPNVFSPNDGTVNSLLTIQAGPEVSTIQCFQVYNRWGQLIHEGTGFSPNDSRHAWDGNLRDQPLPSGVYKYVIQYVTIFDDSPKVKNGTITLIQ